jgi:hypothetical protein
MKLNLVVKGAAFSIWAIDESSDPDTENCPAKDFIKRLVATNSASARTLVAVLNKHASNGPILNQMQSRIVDKDEGLYEFKSRQGARLIWFYARDRRTILTHGFSKGAKLADELKRAKTLRGRWEATEATDDDKK